MASQVSTCQPARTQSRAYSLDPEPTMTTAPTPQDAKSLLGEPVLVPEECGLVGQLHSPEVVFRGVFKLAVGLVQEADARAVTPSNNA